MKIGQNK